MRRVLKWCVDGYTPDRVWEKQNEVTRRIYDRRWRHEMMQAKIDSERIEKTQMGGGVMIGTRNGVDGIV